LATRRPAAVRGAQTGPSRALPGGIVRAACVASHWPALSVLRRRGRRAASLANCAAPERCARAKVSHGRWWAGARACYVGPSSLERQCPFGVVVPGQSECRIPPDERGAALSETASVRRYPTRFGPSVKAGERLKFGRFGHRQSENGCLKLADWSARIARCSASLHARAMLPVPDRQLR
jgi:hypothetical protein